MPEATTNELAVQHLKNQEAHIGGLRTQYQVQMQKAEALREQNRQEAVEAEKLAKAERLEKEKELPKETEKRHLPIYSFQKGLSIDSIPLQLHPYTKKMMTAHKYVPLWPQVMRAKSAFLNALQLGTWPDAFIFMFADFYSNMDMHHKLQEQDRDQVMAHYHMVI
ncbi:hypothetical protein C8J55DRAFT_491109 [Lentinula edodes]|uniref:Uncharacterized protein n=1 Tax=Lentinula lateritia TaxID=40482 RepID=A0A9W9A527_9AGAR|nr:hypothetical protein C8J55DRAFT_491109 [Lentinula edodes]